MDRTRTVDNLSHLTPARTGDAANALLSPEIKRSSTPKAGGGLRINLVDVDKYETRIAKLQNASKQTNGGLLRNDLRNSMPNRSSFAFKSKGSFVGATNEDRLRLAPGERKDPRHSVLSQSQRFGPKRDPTDDIIIETSEVKEGTLNSSGQQ